VLVPRLDYAVLLETLFQMIRQKSAGNAFVLCKLIDVISAVKKCERDPARLSVLDEQAGLVLIQAEKSLEVPADMDKVQRHFAKFKMACRGDVNEAHDE
jgi:uncharacterized membrane protein